MDKSFEREYQSLLDEKIKIQTVLPTLTQGYISKKRISGKQYHYLQQRRDGKIASTYIPERDMDRILAMLDKRKEYSERLTTICNRMQQIEQAAALLGGPERRKISRMKLSAGMDALSVETKEKSVSFGAAMNAIEGVPASPVAESALAEWMQNEKRYYDALTKVLWHYGFSEEG